MAGLGAILKAENVRIGSDAASKDEVLREAVGLLGCGAKAVDREKLLSDIRAREALSSTGIGEGVAVPHALCDSLSETCMAALRLSRPVEYGSVDGRPVDLVFLMIGPRADTAKHLKLLSKLARLLHEADFRAASRAAPDADALVRLIREKE